MARGLLIDLVTMKPTALTSLDSADLDRVRGGMGALLGSLLGNAGPILNGVASIIGAAKSGGGGGGSSAPTEAAPPAQAAPPPAAAPVQQAIAPGMPSGGCGTSISISINGVPQRVG